jgi:CheY-like chemotaxis protein
MPNPKILYVEDDPLMERAFERIFRSKGYDIEIASSAGEALKRLREGKSVPHLILLDVMLPDVHGVKLLEDIKQDENLKNIPVIMLSNVQQPDIQKKCLELGAKAYFIKSEHDPDEILQEVKKVLEHL